MDAPFKIFTFVDGRSLELYHDETPESPREWDNLGTMAFFHNRYELGDKDHGIDHTDFGSWDEMAEYIVKEMDGAIVLPVRMYDHSGIGFAMGLDSLRYPFNCPWDSGQVGFVFVTKAKLIEEYGSDDDDAKAKAMKCLEGELETYNQYHAGDICGFILRDKPCETCDGPGEAGDSCWGFYGDNPLENGIVEHLDEQYREELKAAACDLSSSGDVQRIMKNSAVVGRPKRNTRTT